MLSIAGDVYGKRKVDTKDSDPLSLYFLLRPGISKTFGKHASVFVKSEIHVGKDEYQVWKGYELPERTVDFGLTVKL